MIHYMNNELEEHYHLYVPYLLSQRVRTIYIWSLALDREREYAEWESSRNQKVS